jgi:hypothetical protein
VLTHAPGQESELMRVDRAAWSDCNCSRLDPSGRRNNDGGRLWDDSGLRRFRRGVAIGSAVAISLSAVSWRNAFPHISQMQVTVGISVVEIISYGRQAKANRNHCGPQGDD